MVAGLRRREASVALAICLIAAPALAQPRGLLPPTAGISTSAGTGSSGRWASQPVRSTNSSTVLGRTQVGATALDQRHDLEPPPSSMGAGEMPGAQTPLQAGSATRAPLLSATSTGWMSRSGLAFARNAGAPGNRVQTVVAHANDTPTAAGPWGVFEGGGHGAIEVVDEAWRRAQLGGAGVEVSHQRNATVYTVDLGRRVGYVGGARGAAAGNPEATRVRLVVAGGNNLVTAYPIADTASHMGASAMGPTALPSTPSMQPTAGLHTPLLSATSTGWMSRSGLAFARNAGAPGNRVQTVVAHASDTQSTPGPWGVFDGGGHGAVEVVDEAWRRAREGGAGVEVSHQRGNTVYTVDLGRRVGYVGGGRGAATGNPQASRVRLIVAGSNNLVSAYPIGDDVGRAHGAGAPSELFDSRATLAPRSTPLGSLPLGRSAASSGMVFGHAFTRAIGVHSADNAHRDGEHGVFDTQVAPNEVVGEALERAARGGVGVQTETHGGRTLVTVDMGRRVGFVGGRDGARSGNPSAQHVRVVMQGQVVVSAQPVRIPRALPNAADPSTLAASRRLFSTPFARPTRSAAVPRGIMPGGAASVTLPSGAHRIDAIVFDLDGTLADTRQDIAYAIDHGLRDIGVELPADRIAPLVDGSGLEVIYDRAVPNGNAEGRHRFVEAYLRNYTNNPSPATRLYPGVREMLSTLRARNPGLHFAVATARQPPQAEAMLRRLGIYNQFTVISGSGGTAVPDKPAPDLLLAVSDQLGVPPANMLMVGDAPTDVTAGRRAGMMTTAVRWGMGTPEALRAARPDLNLAGLHALPAMVGAPGMRAPTPTLPTPMNVSPLGRGALHAP